MNQPAPARRPHPLAEMKAFLALSWPIFIEQTSVVFTNVADSLMLSRVSDAAAGAGGTVINTVVYLSYVVVWLTCAGVGTILSQSLGAGKSTTQLRDIQFAGVVVLVAVSAAIGLPLYLFPETIARVTGLGGAQLRLGGEFLQIAGPGLIFFALMMILAEYHRQYGHTRTVMVAMVTMNVVNIVGNYMLTMGWGPFGPMGMSGIAAATVFSRLVGFAILVPTWIKLVTATGAGASSTRSELFRAIRDFFARPDTLKKESLRIIRVALPSTIESCMHPLVMLLAIFMVASLGPEALTTRTYVFSLSLLPLCFIQSISLGGRILVARSIGSRDYPKASRIHDLALSTTLIFSVGVASLSWLFSNSILGIFTANHRILQDGSVCLAIAVLMEVGRSAANISGTALRAAGDTRTPAIISLIFLPLVVLPAIWLFCLVLRWGVIGFFIAIALDELARGAIFAERWYKRRWFQYKNAILDTD
jgi:putative MATE family efflux protein